MDSNILYFFGGFLLAYLLFVLDEVYTYFRNRRHEKRADKENTK